MSAEAGDHQAPVVWEAQPQLARLASPYDLVLSGVGAFFLASFWLLWQRRAVGQMGFVAWVVLVVGVYALGGRYLAKAATKAATRYELSSEGVKVLVRGKVKHRQPVVDADLRVIPSLGNRFATISVAAPGQHHLSMWERRDGQVLMQENAGLEWVARQWRDRSMAVRLYDLSMEDAEAFVAAVKRLQAS